MHFELHVRGCQCLKDATLTIELKSLEPQNFSVSSQKLKISPKLLAYETEPTVREKCF